MTVNMELLKKLRGLDKVAFVPQDPAAAAGAPPMGDPNMMPPGAPMDPNMAPPTMDPNMAPPTPPAQDPNMMPPAPMEAPAAPGQGMDPNMLMQILQDPQVQAALAEQGIVIDPNTSIPMDQATGQPVPPEQMMPMLEQIMMSMQPPAGNAAPVDPMAAATAPPMDPAAAMPVDPNMPKQANMMAPMPMADPNMAPMPMGDPNMPPAQDPNMTMEAPVEEAPPIDPNEQRISELEDLVGKLMTKLDMKPGDVGASETAEMAIKDGLSDEAIAAKTDPIDPAAQELPADPAMQPMPEKMAKEHQSLAILKMINNLG